MKITLTEEIELKTTSKRLHSIIAETEKHSKDILEALIRIVEAEYDNIIAINGSLQQKSYVEALCHATDANPNPKYSAEYDTEYAHMPSYMRRALIAKAISIVKLWRANHDEWEKNGKNGKEPILQYRHNTPLTFYRDNMWKDDDACLKHATIKLYDGHDWKWFRVSLRKTDADYVHALAQAGKLNCPSIRVIGKKIFLDFPVTIETTLHATPEGEERICAIDLGVNNDATCVIMEPDGTVLARNFINLTSEKARLSTLFNRVRKAQSQGSKNPKRKWRKVNSMNEEIVRKTVHGIMEFALEWEAKTIVCEYLETSGKIKGSRKWRLALWRKREVYNRLVNRAHMSGMRIHQVCAWNTSRLAHDGSGTVERGRYICDEDGKSLGLGYSWVRFANGRLYNADLNAALNIGARYFVRAILKSLPVRVGSDLRANVLGGSGGSAWTLSSLIDLRRALGIGHCLETIAQLS